MKPEVAALDIFAGGDSSLEAVLERFDRTEPIAVITEGLVNYFELRVVEEFWHRLVDQLAGFPRAVYLTDTYIPEWGGALAGIAELAKLALALIARSRVSIHFDEPTRASRYFRQLGFGEVDVLNPRDFYERLAIPQSRSSPVVKVVEARM